MRFKNNAVFLGYNFDGHNDHLCKRCEKKEVETTCFCLKCDWEYNQKPTNYKIVEFAESNQFKRAYPFLTDLEKAIVDERIKRAESVVLFVDAGKATKKEIKENKVLMMKEIEGWKEIVSKLEADRREYLKAYKEDYEAYLEYQKKAKIKERKGSDNYFKENSDITTKDNFEDRKKAIARTFEIKKEEARKKVDEILIKASDVFDVDQMIRIKDMFKPEPTIEELQKRQAARKANKERYRMKQIMREKEAKDKNVFSYGGNKFQARLYDNRGKHVYSGGVYTEKELARKEAYQLNNLKWLYDPNCGISLQAFLADRIKFLYKDLELKV